jgi:hypothetical protein
MLEFKYPLAAQSTFTYSEQIKDYRKLTKEDKKILVNNLLEFHKYIFWCQNLPYPTHDQLYMSEYLGACVNSTDPLMLQAQRGLSKSLTVQIITLWLLLRNKNEKIVVVSATGRRAESFTLFCLNLIKTTPLLEHLYPTPDQRSSGGKFDVAGRTPDDSPSVAAFGVTAAKTGSRASFIIYDDVEIPENSETAQKREKLLAGVRDTANLGIAGVFREMCICTPQSSESVYNTLLDDGFKRIVIPSEYPEDTSVYDGDLAPHIQKACDEEPYKIGLATDARLNMAHLIKQKMKGKSRYKLQYMLDTTMSDAERFPLKLSDLIVMDLDLEKAPTHIEYSSEKKHTLFDIKHCGFRGDFIYGPRFYNDDRKEYEGMAMFIDPSGRGSDETAYCVTAQMGGRIFLLDFGGVKGGYDEVALMALVQIAKRYKVNLIQVESNFGDGAFSELLKPILRKEHNCMVEDLRATTNKEKRIINALEPVMMQHRLIINKHALIKDSEKNKADYKFTHQLTHITEVAGSLRHDDIVDVVAMGVAYWQKSLARDTEEEKKRHEDDLRVKSLKKFMEKCGIKTATNVMDKY